MTTQDDTGARRVNALLRDVADAAGLPPARAGALDTAERKRLAYAVLQGETGAKTLAALADGLDAAGAPGAGRHAALIRAKLALAQQGEYSPVAEGAGDGE